MWTKLAREFSSLKSLHHVKKFYKRVEVVPYIEGPITAYTVKLDGKSLKTADGHKYFVANKILGNLVAVEFHCQKEHIVGATLPLVQAPYLVWHH